MNEKADSLNKWLVDALQPFVKEVRVTARSAKKWFDEELMEMRKKKEKLYASAVMTLAVPIGDITETGETHI